MNPLRTFLWFDDQAEEAVRFYTAIFKDSKIHSVARYGEAGPGEPGSVMTVDFELNGQAFVALNGGPHFAFNPAISFVIDCDTQEEVNYFWEKLSEGGEPGRCGWLEDPFGVSWQVVPVQLYELVNGTDAASQRAVKAMLEMDKLDIDKLVMAYEQI
ncbi:MAG TPA: VOC family protein [Anaerolineales bacterium]|nr:VOC family protein [Anaerolineales bacterium]